MSSGFRDRLRENHDRQEQQRAQQEERRRGARERQRDQHDRWHRATDDRLQGAQDRLLALHDQLHGKAPARGEARACLVEAATALFLARGFADVSMQEIADAVGVTKAAMYYHFQSKEDLFEEVARQSINQFWEGIIAHSRSAGPLREVLLGIVAFVKQSLDGTSLRLLDDMKQHCSPAAQQRLLTEHPTPERELQDLFQRAIAAGEMRPIDVEVVADLFLAMMMSLKHRGHTTRQPQPGDDALLIDVLLHGIAPASTPGAPAPPS